MSSVLGWWFGDDTLGHGDGRPVRVGETLTVSGTPVCCKQGLHGSRRLLDALRYANTNTLWRVAITGQIVEESNKLAGTERTALWRLDAKAVLRRFACITALEILPDNAAPCIREFLKLADRATEKQRNVAYWAAERAAERAAKSTAERAAERAAERVAYWAAERAAYWAAESTAERAAERQRQNRRLTAMVAAAHRRD